MVNLVCLALHVQYSVLNNTATSVTQVQANLASSWNDAGDINDDDEDNTV